MNTRHIALGLAAIAVILAIASQTPSVAETIETSTRVEKLEQRVRDLEERMAKVEAAVHSEMRRMHRGGVQDRGQGMGGAMGQPPSDSANSGSRMPTGGGMGGHM